MAIFLFFGEDTFTHKRKLDFWKQEFEKKHGGDMNITILDGKDTSPGEILNACQAAPFLGEKRLTIVKNFLSEAKTEDQAAMAPLLDNIPDFCVLIFSENIAPDKRLTLYKKLQKIAKLVEFPALSGKPLMAWMQQEILAKEGSIKDDALFFLAELVVGDLHRMENEISKLVAYTKGERPITKEDIEKLVDIQLTTSIFKLTDSMGQKRSKQALDILHQLIDSGEDLFGILYMIMRQIRIITCVKDLSEQGVDRQGMISKLKEHPFVISNTMMQARNFSLDQLKRAYTLLIDIDTKLKSGGIRVLAGDNREFVLALDRLVIDLCR